MFWTFKRELTCIFDLYVAISCRRTYGIYVYIRNRYKAAIMVVDQRIKFYSQNTNLLPPKPKSTFRHLKQGIQDFQRKYVLVPADKAANNVVVV